MRKVRRQSERLRFLRSVPCLVCTLCLVAGCPPGGGGPPPDNGGNDDVIPSDDTPHLPFQSLCAQNVIACTTSWPQIDWEIPAFTTQTVVKREPDGVPGFLVIEEGAEGAVTVQLNDLSTATDPDNDLAASAMIISRSWSFGAEDDDPCSALPGMEFTTEPNPMVRLEPGFHYIRLTITNNISRTEAELQSDQCGPSFSTSAVGSTDFLELEIEVRNKTDETSGDRR